MANETYAPKILQEATNLAIENAEQFIKDAEELIKNSSYGHAFALAVLADEELAKAYIFKLSNEGLAKITTETFVRYIRGLRDHKFKQNIQKIFAISELIFSPLAEKLQELVEKKEVTKGEVLDILKGQTKRLMRACKEETKESQKFKEKLRWFDNLNSNRLRGLYIDISGNKLTSPKMIDEKTAASYLSEVKARLNYCKGICEVALPLEIKEEIKKYFDLVKSQTQPQVHKHS